MDNQNEVEWYNYASFVGGDNFLAFRTGLAVGSSAPNFTATFLDTRLPVQLSEYWSQRDVLLEFGSLT